MFEIKYILSKVNLSDAAKAEEIELRYYYFLGNLTLRDGNNFILMDWEWIPILDFALCLLVIYESLSQINDGREEFTFTESDSAILFYKSGNTIKISFSFLDDVLEMSFADFQSGCEIFCGELFSDIVSREPALKNNDTIAKLLKMPGES